MLAALMIAALATTPDASLIQDDDACYAILMPGSATPAGATHQVIRHTTLDGHPILDITIHQRMGARFDMEDRFTLDAQNLRPIRFENRRKGALHVRLSYDDLSITGEKTDANGVASPVTVPLTAPVWEGNLYGVTFAALPLTKGAHFEVPTYQYDKGLGTLTLTVKGEETVQTPDGPVDAWVVDAGADEKFRADYLIAKTTHRELGYRSSYGSQSLGGDCSGI